MREIKEHASIALALVTTCIILWVVATEAPVGFVIMVCFFALVVILSELTHFIKTPKQQWSGLSLLTLKGTRQSLIEKTKSLNRLMKKYWGN
jgi:hypothetical protein